ncbi:helicase-related protein, partial [Rhizobium sp.]|uniref:helicase-related protein n=1 Tax=Rhizobium sp. TaxID=391 RepID=UPI000E864755|nr:ATP-dependent helicase [Rhizobium sp.]
FFPHHGSLSKAEREDVEVRLRDDPRPTTAVATTTLELGIDIGDVESVAQIGPGFSVSSVRQRLGRSGRRAGNPAIMRLFVIEPPPDRGGHPLDRLNLSLVQSIAMIECLKAGWCEPPVPAGLHLSTLLHQVLALIVQTGGLQPTTAWRMLCERGPFKAVDRALFVDLLKCMGSEDNRLIEQSPDGLLMIGENGEKITESYEFYPVFAIEREYRILHDNRVLGTYPLDSALKAGETLIFAGRRWQVITVDDASRAITVKAAKGGKPPRFSGASGIIHDHVVQQMRNVLGGTERFPYIDSVAQELLDGARETYKELGLENRSIIPFGNGVLLLPWIGTRKLATLSLALQSANFQAAQLRFAIELMECTAEGVEECLRTFAAGDVPSIASLMSGVSKPHVAKFDHFLTLDLMTAVTIKERLDLDDLPQAASGMKAYSD